MRYRTKFGPRAVGQVERTWSRYPSSMPLGQTWVYQHAVTNTCSDELHPYPYTTDGPLAIYDRQVKYLRVSGTRTTTSERLEATAIPLWTPPLVTGMEKPLEQQKAEAVADIGAFGSEVLIDVPLLILELKELPKLIRDTERLYQRKDVQPHDALLGWNFGWSPILSDLQKMINLQRAIAQQMQRLRGVLRREVLSGRLKSKPEPLGPHSTTAVHSIVGLGNQRATETEVSVKADAWYSARISPRDWDILDRLESLSQYRAVGFTGNARASTIWNIIPWSFFVDYFTNVGDLVERLDNRFKWDIGSICLMNKLEVRSRTDWTRISWQASIQDEPGSTVYHLKHRDVVGSVAGFRFVPVLNNKQAFNIAALVAALSSRR